MMNQWISGSIVGQSQIHPALQPSGGKGSMLPFGFRSGFKRISLMHKSQTKNETHGFDTRTAGYNTSVDARRSFFGVHLHCFLFVRRDEVEICFVVYYNTTTKYI